MASNSETGHPKNVANFEDLISFCTGYGATYNPVKVSIKLVALNTLRTAAQGTITAVITAGTSFINATNSRVIVFDPIKKLATRIVNALAATDATNEMVEDAKSINRKIQGTRKSKNPPPPPPDPENPDAPQPDGTSSSQQSYDSLIENFAKLIDLVSSEPTYTPNEVELQVATLTAMVTDMRAKNTAVVSATTAISNARIARNKTLYQDKTGLYDIAQEVKKYVKSLFGATSPEYKQVSKIKFTKPRN
ncbi:MAG: hypothetical protein ABI763_10520 [Bacteroidota bacterium]